MINLYPSEINRTVHQTVDVSQPSAMQQALVEIEYHQIDRGPFIGEFRDICFGNTHLVVESQNCTVLKHGALPKNRCHVTFVRDLSTDGRWITQRLHGATVGFLPGSQEFEGLLPAGQIAYFSFDQEDFLAAAARERHWLSDKVTQQVWVEASHGHALANLVDMLISCDQSSLTALGPDYLNRLALDRALASLAEQPEQFTEPRLGMSTAYRIAGAAREFIDAAKTEPLTVMDICLALNVSRRALQYSFIQIYGVAPLAYLRIVRLCRARRDLLDASDSENTVSRIAIHWGFYHLARFAQYYREHFGELPSDTLRRI